MAISINNNTGDIFAGGDETDGDLVLQNTEGRNRIHLDAGDANGWFGGNGEEGNILLFASGGDNATTSQATIHLNGGGGALRLGGNGTNGDLVLTGPGSSARIRLDAGFGNVFVGGNNTDGDLLLFNRNGDNTTVESATIHLNGGGGNMRAQSLQLRSSTGANSIFLGGEDSTILLGNTLRLEGDNGRIVSQSLQIRSSAGVNSIFLGGEDSTILLGNTLRLEGDRGNIWLGGNNQDGDIVLFPRSATDLDNLSQASIHLNGGGGALRLGGNGTNGDLVLTGPGSSARIHLDAGFGDVYVGGNNTGGDLYLFNVDGDNRTVESATIHLSGNTGDIILRNADCAEEFDVLEEIEPGTVMVLDAEGKLRQSTDAYDKKVVGVISGAGDYKPGIVLDRQPSQNIRMPMALMGKVYCKVDAQYGAIEVGDLLTTSSTPGHAMKADDCQRAFGAVIGKALKPFEAGCGLIPIIIALQ